MADPEFVAMRRILKALKPLTYGAQQRVLHYAASRVVEPVQHVAGVQMAYTNGAEPKA